MNPQSFDANEALGAVYAEEGRNADSLRKLREAVTLGPNSALAWKQGKAHEAEKEVRRSLERYPDQFKLLTLLGAFLYYQGKSDEALQVLNRALQSAGPRAEDEPMVFMAMVHASRGERDQINPRLFRYKPEEVVDGDLAEWIGAVYALLGEKEPAVAWLRQAVKRGDHNYPWFQRDKNWDKLRSDPEFQRIMSEVEGYWKNYTEQFGQAS